MRYKVVHNQKLPNRQDQLDFKRTTIVKAFKRYFAADDPSIPGISNTHPSPLQYGYRTKITPHFDIPHWRSKAAEPQTPKEIGFVEKGRRRILDIEGSAHTVCSVLMCRMSNCNGTVERWPYRTTSPC
jgi:tRNA/tmRNA/rRNA uracil-C5-methylase (TrmA/RlmC/RlmD family)